MVFCNGPHPVRLLNTSVCPAGNGAARRKEVRIMNGKLTQRILCLLLAAVMVFGLAAPAAATGHSNSVSFTKVDAPSNMEMLGQTTAAEEAAPSHEAEDIVRVSIVLDKPSTLHSGFSTLEIAENAQAQAYRADLKAAQDTLTARIEKTIGSKVVGTI